MRKAKKFLLAGLATIACAFGFSACNDSFDNLTNDTEYTYDWTYVQEFVDECDADMTIDGKLDEARWEDAHWLYHGEDNVKLAYTTVFSEKGLYIGAKAEDRKSVV